MGPASNTYTVPLHDVHSQDGVVTWMLPTITDIRSSISMRPTMSVDFFRSGRTHLLLLAKLLRVAERNSDLEDTSTTDLAAMLQPLVIFSTDPEFTGDGDEDRQFIHLELFD